MFTEEQLLHQAFLNHKVHGGAWRGMNFVICPSCQFHVHSGTVPPDAKAHRKPVLWKHWKEPTSYDRRPIVSLDDARLA